MHHENRYFSLAVQLPSPENLELIFESILSNHLAGFNPDVGKVQPSLVPHKLAAQKNNLGIK
jgi:hypothetical protein